MVTRYDVISSRWSSRFWVRKYVFSTFFRNKSLWIQWCKVIIFVILHVKRKNCLFLLFSPKNLMFDKIQDGCQGGDHVWWRQRPPAAPPPIKYTSSCREKMKGFPLKAKSFRNTAMYQKLKEGGGGQSTPLVLRWGMTLRVCPRVNASFHCSEKLLFLMNERAGHWGETEGHYYE